MNGSYMILETEITEFGNFGGVCLPKIDGGRETDRKHVVVGPV